MIWQEGVNTIVMLTNIFSYSKVRPLFVCLGKLSYVSSYSLSTVYSGSYILFTLVVIPSLLSTLVVIPSLLWELYPLYSGSYVYLHVQQECEKYWHNTYSMYGDIHVRQESISSTCHYTIRQFTISKVCYISNIIFYILII